MKEHRFNYRWTLKEANFTKDKGTVFSCFSCAGGSTMGYKLAGFDVIGNCEIEKGLNDVYVANHNSKYTYNMDIRDLVKMAKEHTLPKELYCLDVLDGSPPCTSFSMSGVREKYWGKEHSFKEGATKQVLDTLFFDFIELANILRPKVVIAENVKGILLGNAKNYVRRISTALMDAGYKGKAHLLNAQFMGVPQRRERVFFIYVREDLIKNLPKEGFFEDPKINLDFREETIPYGDFADDNEEHPLFKSYLNVWEKRTQNDDSLDDINFRLIGKHIYFNAKLEKKDKVLHTIAGKQDSNCAFHKPSFLSDKERIYGSTFPEDFNFLKKNVLYICGMSVPPIMMAQVATEVFNQWLSKI